MTLQLWLMAGGFVLQVLCTIVGVTWIVSNRLRDHEATFAKAMADHQISDNAQFAMVRSELVENGETIRHEFGEVVTAARQKMHDMETWNRDTFLRRDSFFMATKEMGSDIKSLIEKVTRMEAVHNSQRE